MAKILAQEVNGQKVGATYSGPSALLPWLEAEGYVYDDTNPTSHINSTAAMPADDPTLAVNREDANDREDGTVSTQKYGGHLLQAEANTITPATGPAAGGTAVKIEGDGLVDVTAVTFGGTPALELDTGDDETIFCKAPPHAAGAVDVAITDARGTTTKTSFYTYT